MGVSTRVSDTTQSAVTTVTTTVTTSDYNTTRNQTQSIGAIITREGVGPPIGSENSTSVNDVGRYNQTAGHGMVNASVATSQWDGELVKSLHPSTDLNNRSRVSFHSQNVTDVYVNTSDTGSTSQGSSSTNLASASLVDGASESFTTVQDGGTSISYNPSLHPPEQPVLSLCHYNSTELFYLDLHNISWEENCTVNYSSLEGEEMDVMYKHPVLGGLLAFFAVVTILGNLLVIAAVVRERYLRTVTNYFIVSLAIADLIIGGVVMPFSIFLEITNNVWIFGSDWCDVWHSFDVLASTASILNLSVISLDRYWAITDPIAYPSKMSTGRSFVLMALIWICSAAISFPAILWWRSVVTEPLPPHVCSFTEDSGYLIFSSLISFYFPVSIILFAYYKIYRAATEQTRSLRTGCKVMSAEGINGEVLTLRIHRGGGMRDHDEAIHYSRAAANSDSDGESPSHITIHHHITPHGDVRPSRMISRKWKHFAISKKLSKLAKEQKAAKTLGIVMGVFCICWVPFFIANVLYGICNLECVLHAEIIFPVFTWLGYINSGMNPVIYACSMRDFRRAFLRILCCMCPGYLRFRSRKRYMETNYSISTSSFGVGCGGERCSNVRL